MKKIIGWIAAALVLSMVNAQAQEASRRALAEELLGLMNMQKNIEKSFAMVKQMIPAQGEKVTPAAAGQATPPSKGSSQTDKMMDLMATEFSWDKIKEDYIVLYAETFTEEEMKGVIAFYKSPAGQAFLQKQPELIKRSTELAQKKMMKLMPKIQAMAQEQAMAQIKATPPSPTVPQPPGKPAGTTP